MSKTIAVCAVVCGLLVVSLAGVATANRAVGTNGVAMMVSPSTVCLARVDTVTVHTNVQASAVVPGSLRLEDAEPIAVGIDDCGDIMAKFAVDDVGLERGNAVLTLTGDLTNGDSFSAKDMVKVR